MYLQPIQINRDATLQHFIKPITEQDPLFNAPIGTRRVALYTGVQEGDPLASFTLQDFVLQDRPSTSDIDNGGFVPFGSPTASKQSWALKGKSVYIRLHSEVLSEVIGLTPNQPNGTNDRSQPIVNNLLQVLKFPFIKNLHLSAFWSHASFDPATDYTLTHSFPSKAITELQSNQGFLPLLKDALDGGAFTNYATTGGSGVTGATLTKASAGQLLDKLIENMPRKLRNLHKNQPFEFRPYGLLSNDFYHRAIEYVADSFSGTDAQYLIVSFAEEGVRRGTPIGFMYRGYEFYNGGSIFDEYWEYTNPASTYNHMGMMSARENLSVGVSLRDFRGTNYAMEVVRRTEPEYLSAVDVNINLYTDYLIGETSLFSTVGFEQLP